MSAQDIAALRNRRGHWLRLAREEANLNQSEVARQLGLSEKSGSTITAWEQGKRDPSVSQLLQMARLYGVPAITFLEPEPTDVERLRQLASAAVELEQRDWVAEGEPGPDAGAGPDGLPRRRSA